MHHSTTPQTYIIEELVAECLQQTNQSKGESGYLQGADQFAIEDELPYLGVIPVTWELNANVLLYCPHATLFI